MPKSRYRLRTNKRRAVVRQARNRLPEDEYEKLRAAIDRIQERDRRRQGRQ